MCQAAHGSARRKRRHARRIADSASASSQAPLISLATKLLEFVREYDPETLVIKRGDGKRNHPSPLCLALSMSS